MYDILESADLSILECVTVFYCGVILLSVLLANIDEWRRKGRDEGQTNQHNW